ncbi:MAG TPA: sigma 54-interacting transcriptional regulator [Polyangiaceae bacterium]|jgi:transcriptional regulator with GAF, ATPase, and Fis domain
MSDATEAVRPTSSSSRAATLPPRYEPVQRLGAGGGGEVWQVRDRVSGRVLALKVLAPGAGESEIDALVRETVSLSGLEGLGVPRVTAFGALRDGRPYMVRELIEGKSLDEVLASRAGGPWLEPIASACEKLTLVHRAGLLHGDVKPANIIVLADGSAALVDLGLAAPWREGGAAARGLTPRYAAPELLDGQPLTVRAEVYAIGATLNEALARRGDELEPEVRAALAKSAARATQLSAAARWPSVDELASALRREAGLPPPVQGGEPPWPVLGLDETADVLLDEVRRSPGSCIAVEGPRGAGKTTLVRRIAWTLGVAGRPVALIESAPTGMSMHDVVALELAEYDTPSARSRGAAVFIVDDGDDLDEAAGGALRAAMEAGALLVLVASQAAARRITGVACTSFVVPPIGEAAAAELLQRSVPSLPDGLRAHLVERVGGRPGALRAAVRRIAGKAIVSPEDVDAALEAEGAADLDDAGPGDRANAFAAAERALDMGRFDDAEKALASIPPPSQAKSDRAPRSADRVRLGLARARLAVGRGDGAAAMAELDAIEQAAVAGPEKRAWYGLRARAQLRSGEYSEAAKMAQLVVDGGASDILAADALSVRGVALAFTGEDTGAGEALDRAVRVARGTGEARAEAVALGSAAIAHQRAGRTGDAREAYEGSLAAAEKARDAATVAAMRLNLAGLAQEEGELAQALVHLEAAVDMGERAGNRATVTQALLNLANLDLYLGRWARARASIDVLAARRDGLSPAARAQLLGLEAMHAARTGDVSRSARLYEDAATLWDAQGRARDAAESRLEGLLARAREPGADPRGLARELDRVSAALGGAGFGEHAALAEIVRGSISRAAGDEDAARRGLDRALDLARKAGRREWAWQALEARARLASAQGGAATSRRDTEEAVAMLEETAAKLPRDLREVFWDDPRRRALRQAHATTVVAPVFGSAVTAPSVRFAPQSTASQHAATEDRLGRVLEVTRELASEHDVPRLLQRVTDHAVDLLGAERGFVLLVGERGELERRAFRAGAGEDDPHAKFSRSVAERVVAQGEPVVTVSAREDERLAQAVSVHQLMIQSIACVPIRGAPPLGRTIGALYVETRLRPGVRFERELPTLSAFADQAAIAIENARLLGENRARADDLARANGDLAAAHEELARLLGKRTEQLAEARRDLKQVRAELRSHFGYAGLIGTSAAMRRVYALIERLKDIQVPVLVTGESGTGKEMIARAIHQAGPRVKKPFIGVNCGAIPANLLESELFGSVRGAFTGADRDRRGLFREADGGTILLDEIGEMPPKMQTGLLRALQEKCVRPVGSATEEPVDVRIVAATNRDLGKMVAAGTFREDLYYRLHVVEVHVPPLRERIEDIPPLIDHFLTLFAARYRRDRRALSRAAVRKASAYPWPGNVRQLEHVLLNAWLMSDDAEIAADDFELPAGASLAPPRSSERGKAPSSRRSAPRGRSTTKSEHKSAERERILSALAASNWNRAKAAKMIGVPRRTFYRRLKEFGIV